MNKDKIIVNAAVLILLLVGLLLLWFKFYVSTPHYFSYINTTQGYALLIPADWAGNYEVVESDDLNQTSFMFKSPKQAASLLFLIKKTTVWDWDNLKQNNLAGPVSRELARVGDSVYYAQWLANNPYQQETARIYLDMVRDLSIIFDSFKLSSDFQITKPEFCIQVITKAVNHLTGEIKEFPTPCNIPEDWEVLAN